jgi:hypothetical protein
MTARSRFLPLLVLALLVGACTATTSPSPEASVEPSASEEPAASKPQGSAPQEPTPKPCVPGFVCGGELVPGEYTSTSTGVTITFTLSGEGWSGAEDTPEDGFALFNDAVGGPHGISVVAYYGEVFSDVCSPDATEMIGTTAADFVAFLAAVDGIGAEAPVDTTTGGLRAIRLDLTTGVPCTDFGGRLWLWTLPVHGDFHLDAEGGARVYAIDAGNVTLAIVIEAYGEADYDVLLQEAEAVIATMIISPGS